MDNREMVYAKMAVLAVKDWDVFQAVIRNCRRILYHTVKPVTLEMERKK